MKGLDISRSFYNNYGKPMLEKDFPEIIDYVAVGYVGSGSERYGFDDDVSMDHDYEHGFCIFIPGEDIISRRDAFTLERAYAKLPKEFCGLKRLHQSPVGGNRNGVIRTSDFYKSKVGSCNGNLSIDKWLSIPDYALAEATNGEVFFDAYGEFSKIRKSLLCMPEDIRIKRLAGNILLMSQSGQYNFARCLLHKEKDAAQLACYEFVNATMKTAFLLKKKYLPYYKWSFRALRETVKEESLAEKLSFLLSGDNSQSEITDAKYDIIEEVSCSIINELHRQNLSNSLCDNLEMHAYLINDKIKDERIRNMNILCTV